MVEKLWDVITEHSISARIARNDGQEEAEKEIHSLVKQHRQTARYIGSQVNMQCHSKTGEKVKTQKKKKAK